MLSSLTDTMSKVTIKGVRNKGCTDCKMHKNTEKVCQIGFGSKSAKIMVVSKMPNSGTYQTLIEKALTDVGIDISDIYWTAAIKCRNFEDNPSNGDVKVCRQYQIGRASWRERV